MNSRGSRPGGAANLGDAVVPAGELDELTSELQVPGQRAGVTARRERQYAGGCFPLREAPVLSRLGWMRLAGFECCAQLGQVGGDDGVRLGVVLAGAG